MSKTAELIAAAVRRYQRDLADPLVNHAEAYAQMRREIRSAALVADCYRCGRRLDDNAMSGICAPCQCAGNDEWRPAP